MKPATIAVGVVLSMLATAPAVAQAQQPPSPPTHTMPRADTPVSKGDALSAGRAALIRFDGVRGESRSRPGWIDAWSLTVTCGEAQTAQAGQDGQAEDSAAGRQRSNTLTFTHRKDSASPALFDAAAAGKRFRTAEIDQPGTKLKIEDVEITRVMEEARGTSRATETITLSFRKCTRQ